MINKKTHIILFVFALFTVFSVTGCVSYNNISGETTVRGVGSFDLPVFPQTGSHKVMVFSEMHYQQSYRSQEGPRLLPPIDSVPITGKELTYNSLEEYQKLSIPQQFLSTYNEEQVKEIYRVNCLVCHALYLSIYWNLLLKMLNLAKSLHSYLMVVDRDSHRIFETENQLLRCLISDTYYRKKNVGI